VRTAGLRIETDLTNLCVNASDSSRVSTVEELFDVLREPEVGLSHNSGFSYAVGRR